MKRLITEKEIKDWVIALRSDKYVQGRYKLKSYCLGNGFNFCCLGVLCEELEIKSASKSVIATEGNMRMHDLIGTYAQSTLSHMNDKGSTFEEIADFIEKKPLEFFHR